MARSFLLSYLARKAALSQQRFLKHHPWCWLVLETAARHAEPSTQVASTQQGLLNQGGDWPPAGDALCFELVLGEKAAAGFSVGRAPGNDIEIIDNSVSRVHLVLRNDLPQTTVWYVSPINNNSTWIDGSPVTSGSDVPLSYGSRLKLGQAVLRLHDVGGLSERLKVKAAQDYG